MAFLRALGASDHQCRTSPASLAPRAHRPTMPGFRRQPTQAVRLRLDLGLLATKPGHRWSMRSRSQPGRARSALMIARTQSPKERHTTIWWQASERSRHGTLSDCCRIARSTAASFEARTPDRRLLVLLVNCAPPFLSLKLQRLSIHQGQGLCQRNRRLGNDASGCSNCICLPA